MQESWVNAMRSFENGTLKMDGDPIYGMPPHNIQRVPLVNAPAPHLLTKLNPERMYLLGDPRTNQNPAFLVLGIVFYRWHNHQVRQTLLPYSLCADFKSVLPEKKIHIICVSRFLSTNL